MDPIDKIKALEDTTFLLMEEASKRGHRVFHLGPGDITLHSRRGLRLRLKEISADEVRGIQVKRTLSEIPLNFLDCLWIRKDPPFDLAYFHFLLLLAMHETETVMVNRPSSLILGNEKLLPFHFPHFMPKTFVSFHHHFLRSLGTKAVWKPLPERSGRGIRLLSKGPALQTENSWGLAQEFLPAIRTSGDKRVFLLDGKFLAAYSRKPLKGEWLITPETEDGALIPASLSPCEKKIVRSIGPRLKKMGFFFTGVDLIGEKLTEINVTSPGGLPEANHFQKHPDLQKKIIDSLKHKIKRAS